jgi:hypothetical protein
MLIVDAQVHFRHLPAVGRIADRQPGRRLLIDKVRGATDDAAHANQPALMALAKYPNVAVKATGAPVTRSSPTSIATSTNLSSRSMTHSPAADVLGADVTRMPCSWRQCVTMFTEELPWLEGRDLELVMSRAVCNWIGWRLSR